MLPCLLVVACLAFSSLSSTAALSKRESKVNLCQEQKTCGACSSIDPQCGWCKQEGYDTDNKARCDLVPDLVKGGCDASFIVNPEHESDKTENLDVQSAKDGKQAVQIQPQAMHVSLRPNSPFKFETVFRQASNYPVDLYFVMDLSFSMKDDKAKLAELGELLAANMTSITSDFRLGFGSFVDKKTMPYASIVPSSLISPCTGCAPPYGFKNQMRLMDDATVFTTQVMEAPTSGNLDGPEGGFDAIIQAIACESEIGWREASRRMLVYSSDAAFHYAGDGKLGGIVKPNDGLCHLDSEGYYTESLTQDYPSISQLAHKISKKKKVSTATLR